MTRLARSGHIKATRACRLSGVKRTWLSDAAVSAYDPNVWSGRALQENFHRVGGCAVLHQCIRPCLEPFVPRAIMDISAPAISLAVRPQWAIWVTSVRIRREDRSSISFLSSRRPRQVRRFDDSRSEIPLGPTPSLTMILQPTPLRLTLRAPSAGTRAIRR